MMLSDGFFVLFSVVVMMALPWLFLLLFGHSFLGLQEHYHYNVHLAGLGLRVQNPIQAANPKL